MEGGLRDPVLLALVLNLSVEGAALARPGQVAVTTRTWQPPVIDGDLSDPVWAQAVPITDFTQQIPDEGQPPSQRTEVRILYDDRAIYFAFRCFDTDPKTIVANMTRRDRDSFSDAIWLDIDTHGDHQSAYHFELSAAGVQRDGIRTGDVVELNAINWDWDAVWQSAARRDGDGWTAEIAIPLGELRYRAFEAVVWRMEIRRFIGRRSEIDQWVFIPRQRFSEMLWYGPLIGLAGLPASHSLRLMPFVLQRTRNRWSPPDLHMLRGIDVGVSAGLDALYGVTSDLTLNATVLPDFGQVEADEVKLNLTTFELNYPEKRPFFLEQLNLYTLLSMYGVPQLTQPFYSRRIGAAPPGPYIPPRGTLVEAPPSAQILTAGKLTGRIGKTLNVALLEGLTSSETATLRDTNGSLVSESVAPLTNFFVGRLNREWARNLTGGLMWTSVLHRERGNSLGFGDFCPGGSARAADGRCTHDATTASLDMNWRSADGGYLSHATVFGSLISGGPNRTLRDGTRIGSGDTGIGWLVQGAKASGRFMGRLVYEAASPRLDLNDAGFLQSQNVHRILSSLWWREFNWGPTRKIFHGLELIGRNSWDGVRTVRIIDLQSYIDWKNVWYTEFHLKRFPSIFDNRETSDGALTEKADQWGIDWIWRTDRTRWFYSEFTGSAQTTWQGYSLSTSESVVFRPSSRFEISLTPTLNRVTGDPRAVSGPGTNCQQTNLDGSKTYCFGLQNALATGITLRTVLTFMPTMTLQTYAQVFLSSVRYEQLFETTKSGPKPYIYLSDLGPSARDPSVFYRRDSVLNINAVFRWEYLPGSVLYVVYTRSHAGGLAPLRLDADRRPIQSVLDFGALGRGSIEDVFLVKLSYYFAR